MVMAQRVMPVFVARAVEAHQRAIHILQESAPSPLNTPFRPTWLSQRFLTERSGPSVNFDCHTPEVSCREERSGDGSLGQREEANSCRLPFQNS